MPSKDDARHNDLADEELSRIVRLLGAIRQWQEAEQRLSRETRSALRVNENDMKALRYIIASMNAEVAVTAGALAEHLHISTASTTKLLDRLERAGHVGRKPHPTDRRAVTVEIAPETHRQVSERMCAEHARRVEIARSLQPEEREIVTRFLDDLAATALIAAPLPK
ncbi:MarR family winged helix-turn-helix transcriptional regulator [Leifsonia xyli]|nr:MarR family transcriptional regulator [Leifsonia xyli]